MLGVLTERVQPPVCFECSVSMLDISLSLDNCSVTEMVKLVLCNKPGLEHAPSSDCPPCPLFFLSVRVAWWDGRTDLHKEGTTRADEAEKETQITSTT